ncbi:MAG: sodium:solute symporter, partial [Corynebacterium sp.]
MSTASGGLIAASTVAREDVVPLIRDLFGRPAPASPSDAVADAEAAEVRGNRLWVLGLGVLTLGIAMVVPDVVAALTIAYDLLVGGLLVAIIGGIVWRRGTGKGAMWSMVAGTVGTLVTMVVMEVNAEESLGGVLANEPIYVGLVASFVVYVAVSLATPPTDPQVLAKWTARIKGADHENEKSNRTMKETVK